MTIKQVAGQAPAKINEAPSAVTILESPKTREQIERALPKHLSPDRMIRIALTELRKTPKLMECEPLSIMGSIVQAAQLGLELGSGLGHGYLVPFWNKRTGRMEAQFIPGYRGFIDLARRSGQIASLSARCVYEKDDFEYGYGLEEYLRHKPARRERGELTYVYAVARFKDGSHQFEVMSIEEVHFIRGMSKQADSGPWKDHFDEMARKTVIRRLAKYLPLSPELVQAIDLDNDAFDGKPQHLQRLVDPSYVAIDAPHDPGKTMQAMADAANIGHATPADMAADKRQAVEQFARAAEGVKGAGGDVDKILGMSANDVLLKGDADFIWNKADVLTDWRPPQ